MSGTPPPAAATTVELDPLSLAKNSSGVVFVVLVLLVLAAVAVWFIGALKLLQLRRWSLAQARFEEDAARADGAEVLFEMARHHGDAPGARVVMALHARRHLPGALEGVAKRAIVEEQKRASSLMAALGSIGSAGPFVGLFGTVWGIMDAFLRIGREKSASLPVVAPAIGEALIATAVGLFAAIPAVIAYNALSKRVDDLLLEVEAAAQAWVALVAPEATMPSAVAGAPPLPRLEPSSATPAPAAAAPRSSAAGTPPPPAVAPPQGARPSAQGVASSHGTSARPPEVYPGTPAPPSAMPSSPRATQPLLPPTPTPPIVGHAPRFPDPRGVEPGELSGPLPLDRLRRPGPPPFQGR